MQIHQLVYLVELQLSTSRMQPNGWHLGLKDVELGRHINGKGYFYLEIRDEKHTGPHWWV